MEDTTGVTMADMVRATQAVARGRKRAMISADLPIGTYETAESCVENSKLLLEAGAEVTAVLKIPTIGIGAGKGTTGQIRVSYDLLGLTPWSRPGFVKEDLGFARQMTEMVKGIRKSGRGELG